MESWPELFTSLYIWNLIPLFPTSSGSSPLACPVGYSPEHSPAVSVFHHLHCKRPSSSCCHSQLFSLPVLIFPSPFTHASWVVVCEGCHSKIPHTRWLRQQKSIFSQFWSPRSSCHQGWSLVRVHFLACRRLLSHWVLTLWRERLLVFLPLLLRTTVLGIPWRSNG